MESVQLPLLTLKRTHHTEFSTNANLRFLEGVDSFLVPQHENDIIDVQSNEEAESECMDQQSRRCTPAAVRKAGDHNS